MKNFLLPFGLFLISATAWAQPADSAETPDRDIDPVAVLILNKMTSVIGDIEEACIDIEYLYDVRTGELGLVKHSQRATWCVKGSEKMVLDIDGDKGRRTFWYSGSQFAYYSWDNNQYAMLDISGNIIDVVDTISRMYGVEFPGVDVFYPTFAEDVVATSDRLTFLGQTEINGKECFHIAATTPELNWEVWVSKDLYFLPVKLLIRYVAAEGSPVYEFNYSNFDLKSGLPPAMFEFVPPPAAQRIAVKPR